MSPRNAVVAVWATKDASAIVNIVNIAIQGLAENFRDTFMYFLHKSLAAAVPGLK
jgi:hypothetical protein